MPVSFLGYKLDPYYAADFLEHMWQTEPIGTFSIMLSLTGIMLTLCYKLVDILWDIRKDQARQGRFKIEILSEISQGRPGMKAVVANVGREPLVIRDIGYLRRNLLRSEFVRLSDVGPLPCLVNGREIAEFHLAAGHPDVEAIRSGLCVRDSMGKIWLAPVRDIKRVRKQLHHLSAELQPETV